MYKFTLDTNCLIEVDANRPDAGAILQLAQAHSDGLAHVAIIAMAASERQKGGFYAQKFRSLY